MSNIWDANVTLHFREQQCIIFAVLSPFWVYFCSNGFTCPLCVFDQACEIKVLMDYVIGAKVTVCRVNRFPSVLLPLWSFSARSSGLHFRIYIHHSLF